MIQVGWLNRCFQNVTMCAWALPERNSYVQELGISKAKEKYDDDFRILEDDSGRFVGNSLRITKDG